MPLAASLPNLPSYAKDMLVSHLDISRTILELTLGPVTGMEGRSLYDLPSERTVFYEQGVWGTRPWQFGSRSSDATWIYSPEERVAEFYCRSTDPEQRKPPTICPEDEPHPGLQELVRRGKRATLNQSGLSEEQIADALKKLGYI